MLLNPAYEGRVLVIGDLMLDRYVLGNASRLSPEAPVPVLKWTRDQHVAGGAANVAANIASLGGAAALAGVVGEDEAAHELRRLVATHAPRLRLRNCAGAAILWPWRNPRWSCSCAQPGSGPTGAGPRP